MPLYMRKYQWGQQVEYEKMSDGEKPADTYRKRRERKGSEKGQGSERVRQRMSRGGGVQE